MRVALKSLEERAIEWFSALVMLAWGITLAAPGETLAGPAFEAFHRFGVTEMFWAYAFTLGGVVRLAALYINGRRPRSPHVRMGCSLFSAITWGQVAFLLLEPAMRTGVMATGPAVYGLIAVFDVISIYRAAYDARYHSS